MLTGPHRLDDSQALLEINGTRHPLVPPSLIVGRGTDTDVRINDPGISRQHVEFTVSAPDPEDGGRITIGVRDLGSTNGMLVDGHPPTAVGLRDGSLVRIGNTDMVVRVVDEDSPLVGGLDG